ncbi:hypothetical protein OIV83_000180 [Microbotryomycetes sp. JL201]|nr:hypothetical protein OIV83_000180 [Microbotryomycetes sp. JL201]
MAAPPKYLVTVIPPEHLPHDPPHPKSNPNCSGYGPPEHFRRGTLVPLQPTLPSQLAAIAREYGLPSTGGLVLYLLSTIDPWSASPAPMPGASGLENGPRIGEEAWSMLWHSFFEDELDQFAFDEESQTEEDEEYPPVPPIPASLRRNQASEAGSSPTYGDMRHLRPRKARASEQQHEAVMSDGADELGCGSSDLTSGDVDAFATESLQSSSSNHRTYTSRSKHATRPSVGRGLPSGLPSPGPSRRGSVPARLSSMSHPNPRHASQPLPNGRSRHVSHGPSLRSFSAYSAYQKPSGPALGAPVIVGKVEFDIDRRRGGKARWYETWLESADSIALAPSVAASPLPTSVLQFASNVSEESEAREAEPMLLVPGQIQDISLARDRNIEQALSPARGLRPLELSRNASPVFTDNQQAQDNVSPTSVAASGYSNTAMAGHGDEEGDENEVEDKDEDEDEDEQKASSRRRQSNISGQSFTQNRSSRRLSYPSPRLHEIDRQSSRRSSHSSLEMSPLPRDGYEQIGDGEEERTPLVESSGRFSNSFAEDAHSSVSKDSKRFTVSSSSMFNERVQVEEPLAGVFPNDEATWQELKNNTGGETASDTVETTGLGIFSARTLNEAHELVRERPIDRDSLDSKLALEDEVAEVMDLLQSRPAGAHDENANLASPIRLGSGVPEAPETGKFEGEDEPQNSQLHSPPVHDRTASLSSVRTNPLVSIDVRPPSTAYSSPEYVPQRKQRNGWAAVPPVVDRSMSASSSLQSIVSEAQSDSQRASTIGLMENLDDLERALADLSPSSSRKSPVISEQTEPATESISLPPSPLALAQAALAPPPSTSCQDPRQEAADIEDCRPTSPGLSSRPVFRYGQSLASPTRETPVAQDVEQDSDLRATDMQIADSVAPESPIEISRPPRSASLRKPAVEPAQIALPPSPMPPQTEAAWQSTSSPSDASAMHPEPVRHVRRPPPLPIATQESAMPHTQPSPKSPGGGLKSLRPNKSWRKNKENDKSTVSDTSLSESTSQKNPALNAFFHKPAFQKLGGMFSKKTSSEPSTELELPSEPDFILPAELAPPPSPTVGIDHLQRELVGPDLLPPQVPSKDEVPSPTNDAPSQPSAVEPIQADSSIADVRGDDQEPLVRQVEDVHTGALPSQPDFLDKLVPGSPFMAQFPTSATVTSQNMQPSISSGSYQSAVSELSGTATPLTPTELGLDQAQILSTPKVPSAGARGEDRAIDLSSPRSEYDPRTPVQPYARSDAALSAPTTPAAWTKHLEPGSRFGSKRSKQQINDNIDLLLSQMSNIDFSVDEAETVPAPSTPEGVISDGVEARPTVSDNDHDESALRRDSSTRPAYPKSMDLSRLGDMMLSSPSPPSSPYGGISVPPLPSPPPV